MKIFTYIEGGNRKALYRYLSDFVTGYKHRLLDPGYYREFNQNSKMISDDGVTSYDDDTFIPYEGHEKVNHLNIDYNFANVLIPLMKILIY